MKLKKSIAIAGSHGKTTTTSLVGSIFDNANYYGTDKPDTEPVKGNI